MTAPPAHAPHADLALSGRHAPAESHAADGRALAVAAAAASRKALTAASRGVPSRGLSAAALLPKRGGRRRQTGVARPRGALALARVLRAVGGLLQRVRLRPVAQAPVATLPPLALVRAVSAASPGSLVPPSGDGQVEGAHNVAEVPLLDAPAALVHLLHDAQRVGEAASDDRRGGRGVGTARVARGRLRADVELERVGVGASLAARKHGRAHMLGGGLHAVERLE